MRKTTQLKQMLTSKNIEFLMEAHSGISAKIVEEAGFKGIWASGLSISASLGLRDNNEASWTQVLDVVEYMSDATTIPILLDGDTGYGNFNNMRRLVKKLEQRGIGGVCIEDKLFPKTNSFLRGEAQPLADIEEFCGKIKAGKDSQSDSDFMVVARVEAFIAGWGLTEALKRAEAYRNAGADAILIHSKKSTPSDIDLFMKEWGNRHPVVIVPTKYYSTPTKYFEEIGISTVIWANHNMRSSITAMKNTTSAIFKAQSLIPVEDNIVPVKEIFRLQGEEELEEAEKRYLPSTGRNVSSIILAAGQGEEFGTLTQDIPKTLLKVHGKTILSTMVDHFNHAGIKNISVVCGHKAEKVVGNNFSKIENKEHLFSGELYSLYLAKEQMSEDTIISYGDIVYKSYILSDLLNDPHDIVIVADADFDPNKKKSDFIKTNRNYCRKLYNEIVSLEDISQILSKDLITGEFIGVWRVKGKGKEIVKNALEELKKDPGFMKMDLSQLFKRILKETQISVAFIKGSWMDIDTIVDLQEVNSEYF